MQVKYFTFKYFYLFLKNNKEKYLHDNLHTF